MSFRTFTGNSETWALCFSSKHGVQKQCQGLLQWFCCHVARQIEYTIVTLRRSDLTPSQIASLLIEPVACPVIPLYCFIISGELTSHWYTVLVWPLTLSRKLHVQAIFHLLLQIHSTPLLLVLCPMRPNCFDHISRYPYLWLPVGFGQQEVPAGDQR